MSFNIGDSVRITDEFAAKIRPNRKMLVNKKKSEKSDCVWVEFLELPVQAVQDNLFLVPLSMLELDV
jgi:hypothetical protein